VVSFRRVNAGIVWVRQPGDYANPIPTTSETGPPQYEDLDLIVKQALEWEMKLAIKNQLGREASNRI
jgi:hypothetical protein